MVIRAVNITERFIAFSSSPPLDIFPYYSCSRRSSIIAVETHSCHPCLARPLIGGIAI
jgi:hypothetical protein